VSSTAELQDVLALVRPELARMNAELAEDLRPSACELKPLIEHVVRYRGKQLRPGLVFLAGKVFDQVTPAHMTAAKVVELIHTATLVHDDILDSAEVRRQEPTLNQLHGNEVPVLLGDYIYALAFHMAVQLDDPACARLFSAAVRTVCEGEITQCLHRGDVAWDEARYFEVITQKTASLYGAAGQIGAHYASATPAQTAAMSEFGTDLGIAFQIMDDCLDLTGVETVVGKSLGTDLGLGKLTLPLLQLLENSGDRRPRLLELVSSNGSERTAAEGLRELRAEFDVDASVEYSLSRARGFVDSGLRALDVLPQGPARDAMAMLADYVLRRNF
jgi:octaprenyl-diphosphate synthase